MSDIVFRVVWGDLDLTEAPFSFGFGSDWGAPQSVTSVVASLLVDGEIEMWQRDSNRTLSFAVYVDMGTMTAAAAAEALLIEQGRKLRNTIVVEAGDGEAPAAVYDTFRAQVTWVRDDNAEMQGLRHYDVTMQAVPYVRATESITVAAVSGTTPVTPLDVQVDSCSSLTGWSGTMGPGSPGGSTVSLDSGTVVASITSGVIGWFGVPVIRTGTVDLTDWPYLVVDVALVSGTNHQLASMACRLDEGLSSEKSMSPLAAGPSPTAGYIRVWYKPDVASFATMRLGAAIFNGPGSPRSFRIDQVRKTNVSPFIGNGRQQFGQLVVSGSARTEGSIHISHETDALGEVAAYTTSDDGSGYQPPLSIRRTGGGTRTPDANTASGGSSLLNAVSGGITGEVYDVPASAVPEGTYVFIASLKAASSSTQVVEVKASTRLGTQDFGTQSDSRFVPVTTSYGLHEIGRMTLPPVAVPGGAAAGIRINVASTAAITIDECWMFNLRTGSLTMVRCGTGTPTAGGPANQLWIDTPTLDWPYPAVWIGTSETDRRSVVVGEETATDIHKIEPGLLNLFLATLGAANASADLEYFPRFANNVAALPES